MSADARAEAERNAFDTHVPPSWTGDPVARDAAIRWHMRGFEAGAEWQASRPVTEAEVEAAIETARAKLDAENHEQLCACPTFPEVCVTYGTSRPWTLNAEEFARAALEVAREVNP